jgi:hypothetical protein
MQTGRLGDAKVHFLANAITLRARKASASDWGEIAK